MRSALLMWTPVIPGGIGLHIWAVKRTNPPLELFWQGLFINQATYALTIGFVKASVLCLYWRLFKLSLRWWILGLGLITLGWTIGLVSSYQMSLMFANELMFISRPLPHSAFAHHWTYSGTRPSRAIVLINSTIQYFPQYPTS